MVRPSTTAKNDGSRTVRKAAFLNFKSDGTFPAADQFSTGFNPDNVSHIFLTPLNPGFAPSVSPTCPFTGVTNIVGTAVLAPIRALPSSSRSRIAFSMGGAELGGGNADFSGEVFYQLSPAVTTESTATISLFTDASIIVPPVKFTRKMRALPQTDPSPNNVD